MFPETIGDLHQAADNNEAHSRSQDGGHDPFRPAERQKRREPRSGYLGQRRADHLCRDQQDQIAATGPNAAQIEFWNGEAGNAWTENQARMDVLLEPLSAAATLRYYRAEVHLGEGGQDYDVMGWSSGALINDVLDQYERHLHFLSGQRA